MGHVNLKLVHFLWRSYKINQRKSDRFQLNMNKYISQISLGVYFYVKALWKIFLFWHKLCKDQENQEWISTERKFKVYLKSISLLASTDVYKLKRNEVEQISWKFKVTYFIEIHDELKQFNFQTRTLLLISKTKQLFINH